METRQRTLAKAILWQIVGLISMTGAGWMLTGSASLGGALALINAALGLVIYIAYERAWARVRWGRE